MKRALITGITGQDGSYLAEVLLSKRYKVYGMVRRASTENFERIEHKISALQKQQAESESVIARTSENVSKLNLPPRSLAESKRRSLRWNNSLTRPAASLRL